MPNFECHITCKPPADEAHRTVYESLATQFGWKTSEIARDPLLGKEAYFYFTKHNTDYQALNRSMVELAIKLGRNVVRQKIEQIVLDTGKINA